MPPSVRDPPPVPAGFPPHLRYLRPLAAGASGEVHLAIDPSLDRPVAVKLLRARADDAELRRLHREARTLARLAHPNVVHIYEVGQHADRLFLVMEYVEGGSLLERLRSTDAPLDLSARITAFLEAAEGLAAAHAAGVVHRDVKPANLLIGGDGRVRVADLGLAHPIDESTDPRKSPHPSVPPPPDDNPSPLAGPLPPLATESRLARGGTPAYMAPETLRDGIADARSDQFSWGVSFYEALYGRRPDLPRAPPVPARIVLPPRTDNGERVPGYVREALATALAWDPAKRAASLVPLIAALRNGPQRTRWRRAAAVAGALALASGAGAYALARSRAACPSPDGLLDGTWDGTIAGRVESSLSSSGHPSAAAATAYALASVDDYARRWRDARVEACELTRTRAERSDTFLDLANACLDARRAQIAALVEQLSSDRPDVVASVTQLVATLAPVETCTNPAALEESRAVAFDPKLAARVAEIRDDLSRAKLTLARGLYVEAMRRVDEAVAAAEASGAPLIVAEALLVKGAFHREMGDGSGARTALVRALDTAEAVDAPNIKAEVLVELSLAEARLNESLEASSYHLDRARATLARLSIVPEGFAPWLVAKAANDSLANDPQAAIEAINAAIAQLDDPASVEANELLARLAELIEDEQREIARQYYGQAEAGLAASLGRDHPKTIAVGFNRGLLDQLDGNLDDAARAYGRMLASVEASQGPDAPRLATVHTALADMANTRGQPELALVHGERALAIEAALPVQERTVVAAAHTALSNAHRLLGNTDAALSHTLAAYDVQVRWLPPRQLAAVQINIGEFLCAPDDSGSAPRCSEARAYYSAAADTVRATTDPRGRTEFAYAVNGLGKVNLHARAYAEAASWYLVALEIGNRELAARDAALNAEVHWGLAQARAHLGSRREANAHAVVAFAACVAAGQHVGRAVIDGAFTPSPCIPGTAKAPAE